MGLINSKSNKKYDNLSGSDLTFCNHCDLPCTPVKKGHHNTKKDQKFYENNDISNIYECGKCNRVFCKSCFVCYDLTDDKSNINETIHDCNDKRQRNHNHLSCDQAEIMNNIDGDGIKKLTSGTKCPTCGNWYSHSLKDDVRIRCQACHTTFCFACGQMYYASKLMNYHRREKCTNYSLQNKKVKEQQKFMTLYEKITNNKKNTE